MNGYILDKVSLEDFNKIGKAIHMVCFNEIREPWQNKFHYALMVRNPQEKLIGYSTIMEYDSQSAYMQHGGTFPDSSKFDTTKSYHMMVHYLKERYPTICTRIFNTNRGMLKLAASAGFIINGVEYYEKTENFKGGTLLFHKLEQRDFKGV